MENICMLFINCHLLLIGTQAFAVKDSDVKEFYGDNPVNSLREQVGETEILEVRC
ncbi:hypothetical protein SAMN02745784_00640 [Tissierella praeacuta DSM 18095]|uniref:Uncharacterized protein n=1 Tax=Tissierella praeacuta DSM 18095 TaxID=1123404 RepID=A0A1M4TF34_9FIRM|nr:hypothetical protein [Tissierella praeacuta]SHE42907.1 hypothetical protein SAMN02745784_00640 [Tissierella praeacuta DSM 18095]SUP04695.1 Uncharacterised protein [Tissierella praeacuta]